MNLSQRQDQVAPRLRGEEAAVVIEGRLRHDPQGPAPKQQIVQPVRRPQVECDPQEPLPEEGRPGRLQRPDRLEAAVQQMVANRQARLAPKLQCRVDAAGRQR